MGPFFRRFAEELAGVGARVSKVNFNGGDELYFRGPSAFAYRGDLPGWPSWLREFCRDHRVDVIFLFGDCRDYHREALRVATDEGIPVYVFEEGYLRPNFITLERGGVNGHSRMTPRLELIGEVPEPAKAASVGKTFWRGAAHAAGYSWALALLAWRYPGYKHHRDLHPIREALRWIRGGARKLLWRIRDSATLDRLAGPLSGHYFLVPLQVHNDFQLGHSRFASIEGFLREVVASFAARAPLDHHLVVKHHPMDRPYRDYGPLLRDLELAPGLEGRVLYVADLHLPTMLRHARGTVVINSTVGLQSLQEGTPVAAMGQAVYNVPGLTATSELSSFWQTPGTVDTAMVSRFAAWLRFHNQANGSFIRRVVDKRVCPTGVRWFDGPGVSVRPSLVPVVTESRRESGRTAPRPEQALVPRRDDKDPAVAPGVAPVGGQ